MTTQRTRPYIYFFRSLFTRGRVFGALVAIAGGIVFFYYFARAEAHYSKVDFPEALAAPALPVQGSSTKPSSVSESATSATQDPITAGMISTESTQESRIDSVEKEETIVNQQPMITASKSPIETIEIASPNLVQTVEKPAAPEYKVTQEETIQLVGIVVKTSFKNGQYAQDLEQLWRQYAQSEALFSLENAVDDKTYVAYVNYSEDGNQFTLIIGHRVANFEAVPSDLSQISIPETTYAQFNVTGNLDEAIPNTWEAIELSNLQRAYSTDLEIYDYQQENMAEIWASVN